MRGNWRGIDKKIDYTEQKTESFELLSLLAKGAFFMQGPNFFLKDFFFPVSGFFSIGMGMSVMMGQNERLMMSRRLVSHHATYDGKNSD